jgi:hypothetical protein
MTLIQAPEVYFHNWAAYACSVALLIFGLRQVQLWYRLRHVPGPPFAGWSIGWQISGALSGRYHEVLREAADKYGSCVQPKG